MSRRVLVHILIAALSWALFGYYWWLVAQRRVTENTLQAVQILLILVLCIWAVTTVWMEHNRRRFAGRPDRRTRRTSRSGLLDTDAIGQSVVVGEGIDLASARYLEIEIDPGTGHKTFRQAPLPGEGGAA